MKNLIFSLIILISLNSLTSCSSKKEETPVATNISLTTTADTTILMAKYSPKTAARYSCEKKRLKDDKYLGMDSVLYPVNISLTKTKDTTIILRTSSVATGSSSNTGSSFWCWFPCWLLPLIVAIILLVLLWLLIDYLLSKRNKTSRKSVVESNDDASAATAIAMIAEANASGATVFFKNKNFEVKTSKPLVNIVGTGDNDIYANVNVQAANANGFKNGCSDQIVNVYGKGKIFSNVNVQSGTGKPGTDFFKDASKIFDAHFAKKAGTK